MRGKSAEPSLQVETHRSAARAQIVPRLLSLSRIVERCVEIREGNGRARGKDTSGGVNYNSPRPCQEEELVEMGESGRS